MSDKTEVVVPFEEAEESYEVGLRGTRGTIFLLLLFWILTVVFRVVPEATDFAQSYSRVECDADVDCVRNSIIYRTSIAVIITLVFQALGAWLWTTAAFDRFFLIKYATTALVAFALIYPDNLMFDNEVYCWCARVGGFTMLCLMALVFLDWAYTFNEKIVSKAMSGGAIGAAATRTFENTIGSDVKAARQSCSLALLVVFSGLSFGVLVITMSLLYTYFGGNSCPENVTIITISFVGALICFAVQLFFSSNGSILTSAVIGLYVSYLTFCSVSLNPREECNSSLANSSDGYYGVGPMVIGLILSFVSIFFIAAFTSRSIVKFLATDLPLKNLLSVVLLGSNSGVVYSVTGTALDFKNKLRSILLCFTVTYSCMAFYISMVMTNWGISASDNEIVSSVAAGNTAMFMNAAGAWVALSFYLVALLVPRWKDCLPTSVWDLRP
jgi:hypothetical protein